jgi:hypothetical protein
MGRVSTITATFFSTGNKSPDAELELGVVVTVGQLGFNGASRLESDLWSPLPSVVLHQYVVAVMMNTTKQERAAIATGRPFMMARFTYRERTEERNRRLKTEGTRDRGKGNS